MSIRRLTRSGYPSGRRLLHVVMAVLFVSVLLRRRPRDDSVRGKALEQSGMSTEPKNHKSNAIGRWSLERRMLNWFQALAAFATIIALLFAYQATREAT